MVVVVVVGGGGFLGRGWEGVVNRSSAKRLEELQTQTTWINWLKRLGLKFSSVH